MSRLSWFQSLWAEQKQLMTDPGKTEQVQRQQQKKLLMQNLLQLVSAAEL